MNFCMPDDLFVNVGILTGVGGFYYADLLGAPSYFSLATGLENEIFSLHCHYSSKHSSDKNKESDHQGWDVLICRQILLTTSKEIYIRA